MTEERISILIIEDNEGDVRLIVEFLKEAIDFRFSYEVARTLKEGRSKCEQNKYDVVLLDLSLPDSQGVETFKRVLDCSKEMPVIVLTGMDNTEIALEAVKIGAQDYLQKTGLSSDLLVKSILFAIERKKAEKELKKLNDELEDKVIERTKELAEALEREIQISEMKSSFVTMASHEFRTPLAGILSSANLIAAYAAKGMVDKQERHIDQIRHSVKVLVDILDDFLSVEQFEQGKIESHVEKFDLEEFVKEITVDLSALAKRNQSIELRFSGAPEVVNDKNILRNILHNLLSNAIKYSEENILLRVQGDDHHIQIDVTDRGMGIPMEDQKNLFDKFFRARNVANIQGTGLGLNIVKRYVEIIKGDITFRSIPGQETTFTATFPRESKVGKRV